MDNENNIIISRYAFERMQTKDEKNDLDSGEGGDANYIGNNGDISYGENNSTENTEQDTQ